MESSQEQASDQNSLSFSKTRIWLPLAFKKNMKVPDWEVEKWLFVLPQPLTILVMKHQ